MKRTFITFADGALNEELVAILEQSISEFSKYGLKTYDRNSFDVDYGIDSDPEFWQSGKGYVYKILSCIKALEEFEEVVWIDSDCVATSYIDKIWFESWRLNGYPLLPRARFYLFGRDLAANSEIVSAEDPDLLKRGKEKLGVNTTRGRDFYSQACFMYFDRSCLPFFIEALSLFSEFDRDAFPNGDETIINCLLWRDRISDNLGDIFICSQFFGYYSNEIVYMRSREEFANFRYRPIQNIFENILFYHGSKIPEVAKSILHSLKRVRKAPKLKISSEETNLCEIMRRRGSDKSTWHNYTRVYHPMFKEMIGKRISIFELGIATNPGSSLRAWKEYFIDARVFGADIDREILFEEEGIKTFYCDQTDQSSIRQMWSREELREEMFDIIIDDGLHEYDANITFLESSLHKLKKGGIYIIEDMLPRTVSRFESDMERLREDHADFEFDMIDIPYEMNTTDNSILIARKIS